jgi:hypothetical protein
VPCDALHRASKPGTELHTRYYHTNELRAAVAEARRLESRSDALMHKAGVYTTTNRNNVQHLLFTAV